MHKYLHSFLVYSNISAIFHSNLHSNLGKSTIMQLFADDCKFSRKKVICVKYHSIQYHREMYSI